MKTQSTRTYGTTEKAVLSVYIKNTERSQINDLMLHLKLLEKQEQTKPKNEQKERNNKK
jgi:hypothetical protein